MSISLTRKQYGELVSDLKQSALRFQSFTHLTITLKPFMCQDWLFLWCAHCRQQDLIPVLMFAYRPPRSLASKLTQFIKPHLHKTFAYNSAAAERYIELAAR